MLGRVFAIAMNTYREAVRARVLFGLLAAALAVSAYSLVVASMSIRWRLSLSTCSARSWVRRSSPTTTEEEQLSTWRADSVPQGDRVQPPAFA